MPDLIINALSASAMKVVWMSMAGLAILLLRNSLKEFKNCWQFSKNCFRKLKSLGTGTCRGLLRRSVLAVMRVRSSENNFRKSTRPSLPFFSKTYPSFLTVKEGSTSHLGLLPSGKKRETALLGARNRCALRLADHQRSSPDFAGWDRLSIACLWSEPCLRDETAGGNKQWGMLCSTTLLQLRSLPYARHG